MKVQPDAKKINTITHFVTEILVICSLSVLWACPGMPDNTQPKWYIQFEFSTCKKINTIAQLVTDMLVIYSLHRLWSWLSIPDHTQIK